MPNKARNFRTHPLQANDDVYDLLDLDRDEDLKLNILISKYNVFLSIYGKADDGSYELTKDKNNQYWPDGLCGNNLQKHAERIFTAVTDKVAEKAREYVRDFFNTEPLTSDERHAIENSSSINQEIMSRLLKLPQPFNRRELDKAFNNFSLIYHPDKFTNKDRAVFWPKSETDKTKIRIYGNDIFQKISALKESLSPELEKIEEIKESVLNFIGDSKLFDAANLPEPQIDLANRSLIFSNLSLKQIEKLNLIIAGFDNYKDDLGLNYIIRFSLLFINDNVNQEQHKMDNKPRYYCQIRKSFIDQFQYEENDPQKLQLLEDLVWPFIKESILQDKDWCRHYLKKFKSVSNAPVLELLDCAKEAGNNNLSEFIIAQYQDALNAAKDDALTNAAKDEDPATFKTLYEKFHPASNNSLMEACLSETYIPDGTDKDAKTKFTQQIEKLEFLREKDCKIEEKRFQELIRAKQHQIIPFYGQFMDIALKIMENNLIKSETPPIARQRSQNFTQRERHDYKPDKIHSETKQDQTNKVEQETIITNLVKAKTQFLQSKLIQKSNINKTRDNEIDQFIIDVIKFAQDNKGVKGQKEKWQEYCDQHNQPRLDPNLYEFSKVEKFAQKYQEASNGNRLLSKFKSAKSKPEYTLEKIPSEMNDALETGLQNANAKAR